MFKGMIFQQECLSVPFLEVLHYVKSSGCICRKCLFSVPEI